MECARRSSRQPKCAMLAIVAHTAHELMSLAVLQHSCTIVDVSACGSRCDSSKRLC
jgi:hypothetical protein